MKQNILFVCGSLNQTTMMYKISQHLTEQNCYFTPFYAEKLIGYFSQKGWLDFTILGGPHQKNTERFLSENELPVDFGGQSREYELVVTCTDVLLQDNIRKNKLILVQEGITLPEGLSYYLVRYMGLPRFLGNSAATGLSHAYDKFCVASDGYKEHFIHKGVSPEKIAVTGIPNFDNAESYRKNDFPYHDFILATTSSCREAMMKVDRIGFIQFAKRVADGRKIIFKLHPNEDVYRAECEIRAIMPEARIIKDGNVHQMIAKCSALVTEYSSVVFTALALDKEIHANFDLEKLRPLTPLQNGGASALNIAQVCAQILDRPIKESPTPKWSFTRLCRPFIQPTGQ